MTGAPVFVVSSFVLNFTDGMQGTFLSLQPPCEKVDIGQQSRFRCKPGKP